MRKGIFVASLLVIQLTVITSFLAIILMAPTYLYSGEISTVSLTAAVQVGVVISTIMTVVWVGVLTLSPAITAEVLTAKMTRRLVRHNILAPEFLTPHT